MTKLSQSRALWNRGSFDLDSDETLAQLLDRGELEVFRELYRLAKDDPSLRQRIGWIIATVPMPLPFFWLAALRSLGEDVEWNKVAGSIAESGP